VFQSCERAEMAYLVPREMTCLVLASPPASTRCLRARHAARGGSSVGGHGDVLAGGHRGP
jgi:hypothetical protein